MDVIDLFCFPFAGGNKYSYRLYEPHVPPSLNLVPLEYPGRGGRIHEPLVPDIHLLVDDLSRQVLRYLEGSKRNYAMYGHSMGGLVAYLIARKIIAHNHQAPLHLFITGTMGPSAVSRGSKKRYLLNKKEFIEEVKNLNGSPPEILDNNDWLEYFEPILRCDFQASETYAHEISAPLQVPFTVITGTEEDMTQEEIHLWQNESTVPVDFRYMVGNHFFIFDYSKEIVRIISSKVSPTFKTIIYE